MLIEYKNVKVCQADGNVILSDVNFNVEEGEFIYLIGRVGTGKSSLLKTMYFELDVKEAHTATVLNHDIKSLRRKHIPALRRQMGIIFQDFQLLTDRSVYDNLLFVLRATGWRDKREIDERIETVLKKVGMSNKSYKMPHELSGGEQQRIVIARALLNDPLLRLADEPTGNLDPETGHQIISLLSSISKSGTAILMATHNISLVEEFPGRILKCEAKKIIDMGTDYLSWIEK